MLSPRGALDELGNEGLNGILNKEIPPPLQTKTNPAPDSNTPLSNAGATGRICPPTHESPLKLAIFRKITVLPRVKSAL